MGIFIFGHRNPDTDSVASAIALSYLKKQLGYDTLPCVIGNINKESQYILDYFEIPSPTLLKDVKTQVKDLHHDVVLGLPPTTSILYAYKLMETNSLETLAIIDVDNKLLGIVSMKDIAMGLIKGKFDELKTSYDNLVSDLSGTILTGHTREIEGRLTVVAYYYKTVAGILKETDIVIVGDRYDIIEHAIKSKVQLVIITGGKQIPEKYIQQASKNHVTLMSVPHDTYYTSKVINQCNYISTIMRTKSIIKFNIDDHLDDVKEAMGNSHFRNYPIVDDSNTFIGFINRRHIMNSGKKQVILVDHNEYAQSVEGLREAEILEIIDHHKLGDIATSMPIHFRNIPVGSTCTIIYQMFKEHQFLPTHEIAGLLLSGIISDTMYFKSPTTTHVDRQAVEELNMILNLDLDFFAMEVFKAGTSLEGQSIEEIFYKDFKEFALDGNRVGISQVFTLDIEDVFNRKEEFIHFIDKIFHGLSHDMTLLMVTDILKEGSYLLFKCKNQHLVTTAFDIPPQQGAFVKGIVSRKKQVVPQILEAINLLK
ncbi:putative manganese-dependent inorganic diphosphatase [Alkaliphilus hydrothermalis]|uniref:inorganic diphosphatase n=1 Tax=Alkaliphilus hydrothermalis TaxID=1482730 RepID=A0ABS2NQX4_9FIRM|nr:putative manganese-dependent inorganic diphosphatase [Alkaliphilus hydrothermalis]MBM7615349.1 manganese-dependent inorganic pyrophosphatase [Alkaliphilus hydrothermalis]